MIKLPLYIFGLSLLANAAIAADGCGNLDFLEHRKFSVASVKEKSFFWKDGSGCPDATKPECKTKLYVVAKDEVVTAQTQGDWVCAWFQPAKKKKSETVGWLPKKGLVEKKDTKKYTPDDFVGFWAFNQTTIEIKKAKRKNFLAVEGNAQWVGMGEGTINAGKVEATNAPSGNTLKLENEGCELELKRVGNFLIGKDNLSCGGLNVSFSGVYVKSAPPKKKK